MTEEKRILTTYEVITPESAEAGDAEERGWHDEEGHSCEPDEYDKEDGLSAVDIAVKFLRNKGACHASSSHFHAGVWYSTEGEQDYRTCAETTYSFHLKGFSAQEEKDIWTKLKG